MKHASKIQALEGLLARVQRRAAEPRAAAHSVHDAPTVDHPASPVAARVDPSPSAAAVEAAKAPEPSAPKLAVTAPVVDSPRADAHAPVTVAAPAVSDEPPVTRDSQELEELGPADEEAPESSARPRVVAPPSDELEVLEEDDVIDGSPAPPLAALPVVIASAAAAAVIPEPPPSSTEITSAELVPEPPPPRPKQPSAPPPLPSVAKPERPRSIPPPFPGVAKPPKLEALEADVPQRRADGPTAEQLGGTIDLEEGPPADLELAPVAGPKTEEAPSEHEAVLPKATSPGLFTGPRPSAPQEAPPQALEGGVELDVPPSPAPVPAPPAAPAPAPVSLAVAPSVTARAVPSAEVARFVAASRDPASDRLGDLLRATLSLGTQDRIG